MFIVNLFITASNWNQPKCPSAGQTNTSIQWNNLAIKNKILIHASIWIHLKTIALSEKSRTRPKIVHIVWFYTLISGIGKYVKKISEQLWFQRMGLLGGDTRKISRVMEMFYILSEVWIIQVYICQNWWNFVIKVCVFHCMKIYLSRQLWGQLLNWKSIYGKNEKMFMSSE